MIVNRGKQPNLVNEKQASSNEETTKASRLELLQKTTTNSALADQFPEWDLKPPAGLIKRRSTKLL